MAHSRTAKKNIRQNERHRERNKAAMSEVRTQLKKVRQAIEAGDAAAAQAGLPEAQKLIDKAAKSNRLHKKQAARIKSRLTKAANKTASA